MEIELVGEEHMAKDYLNLVERALMMGISDKINSVVSGDVYVYGEFPETEDLKFPAVIVQLLSSGFDEQTVGQTVTFGDDSSSGTGEIYSKSLYCALIRMCCDSQTTIFTIIQLQYALFKHLCCIFYLRIDFLPVLF